ncbi:FAD:protein FMN transferase [Pedobacter sp. Hv1]|uniref:FAD:protein FMN transferase n=1 Tax=Pedobacter sp. Hv1 TaxID=1740090 RepID=UPI0009E8B8FE|nr:FAD:protein FMN transferase [Pedobacter sp. Hv1]
MKKLLLIALLLSSLTSFSQVLRKRAVTLMGSRFDITIIDKDSAAAEANIDVVIAEVTRIENLISDWRPYTQVSKVNQNAGIAPVKVDKEVFELTQRAIKLSKLTGGAFDISFAAMDRIWKFDGSMVKMPTPEAIKKSVEKVGYQNIILDQKNSTIFLKLKGMKIGFGALGEGYAADRCREMMLAKGVKAGIVNGSGDMNTWGKQPDGTPWNIGITNPKNTNELMAIVPLAHGAVVTSGSYEKFVVFNGKRYAHIINPKTGYPATGLCSVTVFGPSAEMANGLSTSIMVMGKKAGLQLLKRYPKMSCILITDEGKTYTSPNLNISKYLVK